MISDADDGMMVRCYEFDNCLYVFLHWNCLSYLKLYTFRHGYLLKILLRTYTNKIFFNLVAFCFSCGTWSLRLVFFRSHIGLYFLFSSEAATRDALLKKAILEISQNSQENTRARVSFSGVFL